MLVLYAFACEYGPLVILLEDLHLYDTISLQLAAQVSFALHATYT